MSTTSTTTSTGPAAKPAEVGAAATLPIEGKWWGQSLTVWGAVITAAATVAPALGPLFGLDISGETVRQIGGQTAETMRAIAGLAGTFMTIFGRARATLPLVRRDVSLRL